MRAAAASFPALADELVEEGSSSNGGTWYATVGHPARIASPRRYLARQNDELIIYDGLPIDRLGSFPAWDAAHLARRWDELPERLEGMFCAVRIDVMSGTVECLSDVLGMAHLYLHSSGSRWVLGNSVAAVCMASGLSAPHRLGVPSLLTLGWPACGSTLIDGVDQLPGGHVHRLDPGGVRARAFFTAATTAPRRQRGRRRSPADVAQALVTTTKAAGRGIEPLVCGVTAGRDTRVLVALARAARWDAQYYTSGVEDNVDVRLARQLTGRLDLPYKLVTPTLPDDDRAWIAATARFVAQTDGMATLQSIDDWVDHQQPVERLGLKLWGAGGEIGRAGVGLGVQFVAQTWGLRWLAAPQRWMLRRKARGLDLFRPEALEATRAALDRFADDRIEEGWRRREILEAYYAFERVAHWAASGLRRAASGTDLYSPYISRDFIQWCFSLSSAERVVEAPHWQLLGELAPDLREMPFQSPWRPQRPSWAQAIVLGDLARHTVRDARRRTASAAEAPGPLKTFGARWLDAGREIHRELCLSHDSSPLWELVDRSALEAALARPQYQQSRPPNYWVSLCNALTAFWWFHGREAATRAALAQVA